MGVLGFCSTVEDLPPMHFEIGMTARSVWSLCSPQGSILGYLLNNPRVFVFSWFYCRPANLENNGFSAGAKSEQVGQPQAVIMMGPQRTSF